MLLRRPHIRDVPDEREPGETFSPGDILSIDFESKGRVPIAMGTHKYALNASACMLAWKAGEGAVNVTAVDDIARPLAWADMPAEFTDMAERVFAGEAIAMAHNAPFDRSIWNHSTLDFPWLEVNEIIDSRVQAVASGLPAALEWAGKFTGLGGKHERGNELIDLFTLPDSTATPQSHPEDWALFQDYAGQDVALMCALFDATRQLTMAEWQEYWAAQRISERGIGVDLDLVTAAAAMAAIDKRLTVGELVALTGHQVRTINSIKALIAWLDSVLPFEGRDILVKRYETYDEETGEILKPRKYDLRRPKVERLIALLSNRPDLTEVQERALRVLELRLYGGSKATAKFARILDHHVDGVVSQAYVFQGAHTGRFSSRGVQMHNMPRTALPYEAELIDALVDGMTPDALSSFGDYAPRIRKLALLVRPLLVPAPGNCFVWSDWSAIEARVLPWLCATPGSQKRLDIFEAVDADPSVPDIYVRSGAAFSGVSEQQIMSDDDFKHLRDDGKIIELASGFGGSHNALLSRAAATGKHYTEAEAREMVAAWRATNSWAPAFWDRIWDAINNALQNPREVFQVGRLHYLFDERYLGGSLLCILPSSRPIVYRRTKWERLPEIDEETGEETGETRRHLTFAREMGRVKLWYGLAVENAVQATAADLLRGTLRRLDERPEAAWMPVRLHTHDEILVECPIERAGEAAALLRYELEHGFEWTGGLPLKADARIGRWYTKAKKGAEL